MSAKLKLYISRKVVESLRKTNTLTAERLRSMIKIGNTNEEYVEMNVPLGELEKELGIVNANDVMHVKPDDTIRKIHYVSDRANRNISFEIHKTAFIKDIIENNTELDMYAENKRVVVEYSSPNIAKPFHVGHFRSTIIGNFISNINKYFRNDVTRLNYLGDWGTQFGLLQVGIDSSGLTDEQIKKDPIQQLYSAYVTANKLAETDPSVSEKARNIFTKLEKEETKDIGSWKSYIGYTIDELQSIYSRLGITFDEYNYESMYKARDIQKVLKTLETKHVLQTDIEGKKVAELADRKVSLLKSDGSTLYLTRDIAAAVDRYNKYKFDQMYYIVDNAQSDHFNNLKNILYKMDLPWAGRLKHIKFGRIRGMSTRKGTVVFLKDILDETAERMRKKQIESPTTKAPISDFKTSDVLGISCIIINDLKQRRQRDYEFSWDNALQDKGDTGVRLQYTHCRLCSLEKNSGVTPAKECRPELIPEPEVTALIKQLAKFNDVLLKAHTEHEACVLVVYLFHLCNYINKALKVLQVKNQEENVASQRLLLFSVAKDTLRQGMEILGLQPLKEM